MATIVKKILTKYNLEKIQEEGLEKFFKSVDSKKRADIFENLPGAKISKLIIACDEGKVSPKNLPARLKEELNLSDKNAEQAAQEILNYLKPASNKSTPEPEKKEPVKKSGKPDVYREPTE